MRNDRTREDVETLRSALPASSVRWRRVAVPLMPAIALVALMQVRDARVLTAAEPRDPVIHRTVPLTGTIAAIADCGRGLVELRTLRIRWSPAAADLPAPLPVEVQGTAADRASLERFLDRLRAHAFLGDVRSPWSVGAAGVEFEVRLGPSEDSPESAVSPLARPMTAMGEASR